MTFDDMGDSEYLAVETDVPLQVVVWWSDRPGPRIIEYFADENTPRENYLVITSGIGLRIRKQAQFVCVTVRPYTTDHSVLFTKL